MWQKHKVSEYQLKYEGDKLNNAKIDGKTRVARKILLSQGNQCSICENTEWMGQKIPLILDHVDGNSDNNLWNNLRLVCGNCDMLLPTYKAKNKGNGRLSRRLRYHSDKLRTE